MAELALGHFSVFPNCGADWSPNRLLPEVTVVAGTKTRTVFHEELENTFHSVLEER